MTIVPSHGLRAIVVGSGVAGLTTALSLGDCLVLTKTDLGEGSSTWAQGGIAAAVGSNDDPAAHAADTIAVAGGLAETTIVDLVTRGGPERVDWLRQLGARFDVDSAGALRLGREAGHRTDRIVHANGDATGAELMRTLRTAVRRRSDITVLEHTTVVDLLRTDDRVVGVYAIEPAGDRRTFTASAVVLATGGIGRVYSHTTNPVEVTGDGLAMALRAGAKIADPEFVQFHPTGLRADLDPMPLLTEALRGAGAVLVDDAGQRYMIGEHPDAELAPRDVVARATWRALADGRGTYLDATHLGDEFPNRFPTVYAAALRAGIDPRREPMPVSPTAHYHMGGVAVDADGVSSIPGLYAVGEASVSGLHGANRLASNSLLEGLVLGVAVAVAAAAEPALGDVRRAAVPEGALTCHRSDDREAVNQLRDVMWRKVGVIRDERGLSDALEAIERLRPRLETGVTGRNLADVAETVAAAAVVRRESRGGHHRLDYPDTDPSWAYHTIFERPPAPMARIILDARGAA